MPDKLSLKDVKKMVDEKVATVKDAGHQISASELKDTLLDLNSEMLPFSFEEANGRKRTSSGIGNLLMLSI